MAERLTIRRPDDWHVHDGEMLKSVLPFTARHFGCAVLMPNLAPPVRTTADAIAYRARVLAALPKNSTFEPLFTCYLADDTDPDDVARRYHEGAFFAVKLYPAHATTGAAHGVTDFNKIKPVLARMEQLGMPLLVHGEDANPAVDVFAREARFCEKYLGPLRREFPGLKITLEHVSSKEGIEFVRAHARMAGTITPHHLELTRTDWLGWGLKPYYAMPVLKSEADRAALRRAATSGDPRFFLGTDSAPHPTAKNFLSTARQESSARRLHFPSTPRCSRRKARSTGWKPSPP